MSFQREQLSPTFGWSRGNITLRGVGRSSWRGRSRGQFSPVVQQPPSLVLVGLVVDSIDIDTLVIEEEAPIIEKVKYVASYNWLDNKSPIILVPGK